MTEEGVIASLVFFVWRSNLRLLRFARSGKRGGCFVAFAPRSDKKEVLAVTPAVSLRGRIFVSEAVSPLCPNKRVSAQGLLRFARND